MALVYKDRVKATTTTTGTGTLTMGSAVSGFQAFSAIGDGNTCVYVIEDVNGTEWEVGIGTYTASGTTLARTTVIASSNSNNAINISGSGSTVYVAASAALAQSAYESHSAVIPGGRLTLTSGTPVTTSDVTGATSVYYTPYIHDRISLWTGDYWKTVQFTEQTLALGTITSGLPYDVFGYLSSGALAVEKLAWTNGTTRATAITLQDGRYCKSGAKDRLYLGTFYTTATTTTEDSDTKRFLWNQYNQVDRRLRKYETTATWTYGSATTWRSANNSTANRVEIVTGNSVLLDLVLCVLIQSDKGESGIVSIGEDSTSTPVADIISSGYFYLNQSDAGTLVGDSSAVARLQKYPAVGYHYYQWLERADVITPLFFGDDSSAVTYRTGLSGNIKA